MTRLMTLAATLACSVALTAAASAQTDQPAAAPTQQNRMASCNTDAKTRELSGDARKSFMSECLSNKTAASAPAAQPAPKKPVAATAPVPAPAKPVAAAPAPAKPAAQAAAADAASGKVSVNSASAGQLDGLWGVGKVRAAAIIANRPYRSIDDFHNKHVVPENVFERIKDQLSL